MEQKEENLSEDSLSPIKFQASMEESEVRVDDSIVDVRDKRLLEVMDKRLDARFHESDKRWDARFARLESSNTHGVSIVNASRIPPGPWHGGVVPMPCLEPSRDY